MITAKIIKDSISKTGKRIITYECEYPRFIHSELLTHRVFSRNSASSRAIPVSKMISLVWNNPAQPIHWGKNQSGMQAKVELSGVSKKITQFIWNTSGKVCCIFAWMLNKLGAHKQITNRIVEPWSHIKVVITSTEWDNFFYLRNHPDAQPEIHELARQMYDLYLNSSPELLYDGEWHTPYITTKREEDILKYYSNDVELSVENALKVSASMCAQVSYRLVDDSIEKAIKIYDRLIESKPAHASPFEHQARPINIKEQSGNFYGWHQHRQDIPNNTYYGSNI